MMKTGLTTVQMAGIALIMLVGAIIFIYAAKEKLTSTRLVSPVESARSAMQGVSGEMREPAAAKIIASYAVEYDTDEYCIDDEVYVMRCEDSCDILNNGKETAPETASETAFADCRAPKKCCQYPPQEWPAFDEEPE